MFLVNSFMKFLSPLNPQKLKVVLFSQVVNCTVELFLRTKLYQSPNDFLPRPRSNLRENSPEKDIMKASLCVVEVPTPICCSPLVETSTLLQLPLNC